MRGWLFAFVLLGLAFAAAPEVHLPNLDPFENPLLIGAMILLAVSFSALAYAVSTAIQNPSAIAWSKDMVRETIAGVIIVAIVYGAAVTANGMIVGMTGYGSLTEVGSGPTELGSAALDPLLGDLEMVYGKVAEAYFSVAVQQGTSMSVTFSVPPVKFFFLQPAIYYARDMMPYYGMAPMLQSLTQSSYQLTIQMLSLKMVKVFLVYIGAVVPGFLLPLGFVFRIFPLTKKAGDTLIALSLGGLFMLPASLIVVKEMRDLAGFGNAGSAVGFVRTEKFYDNVEPTLFSQQSAALVSGLCQNTAVKVIFGFGEMFWGILYALIMLLMQNYDFFGNFNTFVSQIWPWIIYALQMLYATVLTAIAESADSGAMYDRTIQPIVQYLFPAVSEITAFSIISIIMIAVITYGGTRAVSTALGGEYSFAGITRMV
jgi:hypothetical protein